MSNIQIKANATYTMKALTEEVKSFADIDLVDTYRYYKERETRLGTLEAIYLKVLKEEINARGKVCPKCKSRYLGYPAISRVDNETEICQDCGQREAVAAWVAGRIVEGYKNDYPKGTRIQLLHMANEKYPVEDGMYGTVDHVDDTGTLHCIFDDGRQLGVLVGIDSFRKVSPDEDNYRD